MTPGSEFQQPPAAPKKSSVPIVVIVLVALVAACVPCTGIVAAIAIPSFMKYTARAKQTECKSQLRGLYVAEEAYKAEHDAYTTDSEAAGVSLPSHRYAYLLSDHPEKNAVLSSNLGKADERVTDVDALASAHVVEGLGLTGTCPKCDITIACVGQLDRDPMLDVWSVSSADRTIDGEHVAAGQLHQHRDDLELGRRRR